MPALNNLVNNYRQLRLERHELLQKYYLNKNSEVKQKIDEQTRNMCKLYDMIKEQANRDISDSIIINNVLLHIHNEELLMIFLDEVQRQ